MSSIYNPTAVALPSGITMLDDGDPKTAAGINTPIEAIADGVKYLTDNELYLATTSYTSSGSITVPTGATHCWYEIVGGGGGGGGGGSAAGSDRTNSGGGGGGGAVVQRGIIEVVPGETLNYNIGAGGSAGAVHANGGNGGDTTLVKNTGLVTLATAMGAEGGGGGSNSNNVPATSAENLNANESNTKIYTFATGGSPVRRHASNSLAFEGWSSEALCALSTAPQHGGRGLSGNLSGVRSGIASPQGYLGGNGGSNGSNSSTYIGGGGGGGGGAGPYGAGGAGGNGGNATNSGAATTGSNGTAASANTGAGGGGGGCAGGSNSPASSGGTGGAGGSGRVKLTFLRRP